MNDAALESLKFDERGLIPAVVQEAETGAVLMLAYMNRESLTRTIATGQTHFWSRSRNALWHKGETSGNHQEVKGIRYDCDADALLVTVTQEGNACHTGAHSCFFNQLGDVTDAADSFGEVVGRLAGVIRGRKADLPEGSYTARLFTGGTDRILKKIGEESGE
ncbi:MAG TPA: bifunctional phosphoribosyl-AMP cyclohydrolase/phosphoribosyl-ATP diphosphatase HisIE, partial [Bacteroidota bacterium]|nr:bifunctional phosphoribosyl-AMP cyclohydrolase/phosphoribosyl-ATP diphosphatase HisIE [Bacteroidota bacterium]